MGKLVAQFAVFFAVVAVLFACLPNVRGDRLFCCNMPILALSFPVNERCRWDDFAAMTPLRPWKIVLAKYLFAYSVTALMTALAALTAGSVPLAVRFYIRRRRGQYE